MDVASLLEMAPVLGAIAGILTSAGVIWAFIRKPVTAISERLNKLDIVAEEVKKIDGIERSVEENSIQIARLESAMDSLQCWRQSEQADAELRQEGHLFSLKQAVYNENLPDAERIHAGELFLQHGGNGYTKTYMDFVLKPQMEAKVKAKADQKGRTYEGTD